MRVVLALAVSVVIALGLGMWVLSFSSPTSSLPSTDVPGPTASPSESISPEAANPSPVTSGVTLPSARLTPGVASADVTPANIASTICVVGYTSGRRHDDGRTVRPPSSYTTALKRRQIVQYGYTDFSLRDYEEDHLIPLELGGDGYAAGNLWPEPYAGTGARVKDQVENALHRLVCARQLGLRQAQLAIAHNWYAAYLQYG